MEDESRKSVLDALSLKGKGTNLMSCINLVNLIILLVEVPQLILEVFELGLSLSERLQVILRLLYPEP